MDEKKKPIGELFESIQFSSLKDLDILIETLDKTQALYMLNLSLDLAIKNNIFSMVEIEIISKSLRLINTNDTANEI